MIKKILLSLSVLITLTSGSVVFGQGAAINQTGSSADPSAILDLNSTSQGLLIPRMTTTERNAIASPAQGLQIFNTTTGCFEAYVNSQWSMVSCLGNCTPAVSISANPAGSVCPGTSVTYTSVTVNGGSAPAYQWKINGVNVGSNSSTFTYSIPVKGDVVSCEVTSNAPCASGIKVVSNSLLVKTLTIGESYGGGIIFYTNGCNGLIVASSDQNTSAEWGCYGTAINATGTAIGTGQANTTAINSICTTSNIAADICDNAVINGYSDWYMPSKDELNQLYLQRNYIGNLLLNYYWSSSEYNLYDAWRQNFNGGAQEQKSKTWNGVSALRCVRSY